MAYQYKKSLNLNKTRTRRPYRTTSPIAPTFRTFRGVSRKISSREHFNKKQKLKTKLFIFMILAILFLMLFVYILFFTSIFQIKKIDIVFENKPYLISESSIKNTIYTIMNKKTLYFFSNNNLFIFKSDNLKDLEKKDSRIASLSIKKRWLPARLEVIIKESIPQARLVILGDNRDYYINSRGQVIIPLQDREYTIIDNADTIRYFTTPEGRHNNGAFATLDEADKTKLVIIDETEQVKQWPVLPLFYDQTSTNLKDPILINLFKNILGFIKSDILSKNEVYIDLVNINKQSGVYEIKIYTAEGWYMLINSEMNFFKQLNSLGMIIKDKIDNRQELEYIDLRFGERIFFKLKKE